MGQQDATNRGRAAVHAALGLRGPLATAGTLITLVVIGACGSIDGAERASAAGRHMLCEDYVKLAPQARAAVAAKQSAGLQEPLGGWVAPLDDRCRKAPMLTVGDFFDHFR